MTTAAPQVGIVSLGCPKALVDSERILTKLRADGYTISGTYNGADVVIVNTCGFLDSAKIESLEAIGIPPTGATPSGARAGAAASAAGNRPRASAA